MGYGNAPADPECFMMSACHCTCESTRLQLRAMPSVSRGCFQTKLELWRNVLDLFFSKIWFVFAGASIKDSGAPGSASWCTDNSYSMTKLHKSSICRSGRGGEGAGIGSRLCSSANDCIPANTVWLGAAVPISEPITDSRSSHTSGSLCCR